MIKSAIKTVIAHIKVHRIFQKALKDPKFKKSMGELVKKIKEKSNASSI